jgi:hypothetical protein
MDARFGCQVNAMCFVPFVVVQALIVSLEKGRR